MTYATVNTYFKIKILQSQKIPNLETALVFVKYNTLSFTRFWGRAGEEQNEKGRFA